MKQILCAHLKNWPIDRLCRRSPALRHKPLVVIQAVAGRQEVVAASDEARGAGGRAGITLTQARALRADVLHVMHDAGADARSLEALGRWMMRFTPVVSVGGTTVGSTAGGGCATSALLLDVTGCERLFRGMTNLVRQVIQSVQKLKITARLAVAPTPGAAWALAFAGERNGQIVKSCDEIRPALAPLPPAALRIEPEVDAALHHLGLVTIGQVMELPRQLLPARFGESLLHRLDQALGRAAEPLVPLSWHRPIEARIDFDGVIDSLETIHLAIRKLLEEIAAELLRRGCGARRLELRLLRPHDPPLRKEILLSHPSREVGNLFNLVRCGLENGEERRRDRETERRSEVPNSKFQIPNKFGISNFKSEISDFKSQISAFKSAIGNRQSEITRNSQLATRNSFIAIRLSVPLFEPLTHEQINLMEQQGHACRREVGRLVERLRVRLGNDAVVQAELVESHLPERTWRGIADFRLPIADLKRRSIPARSRNRRSEISDFKSQISNLSSQLTNRQSESGNWKSSPRPLHLLPRPVEVGVIVSPCNARESRPVSFTCGTSVHTIAHAIGPERIDGLWWEGRDKTRDYFDVQDTAGRRFWLFRVLQTGKWYLHGRFV